MFFCEKRKPFFHKQNAFISYTATDIYTAKKCLAFVSVGDSVQTLSTVRQLVFTVIIWMKKEMSKDLWINEKMLHGYWVPRKSNTILNQDRISIIYLIFYKEYSKITWPTTVLGDFGSCSSDGCVFYKTKDVLVSFCSNQIYENDQDDNKEE